MVLVGMINRKQCWLSALILLLCRSGCAYSSPRRDASRNRASDDGVGQCKMPTAQRYPGLFVSNAKITRVTANSSALYSDSYQIRKVLMRIPVSIYNGGDAGTTSRPGFRITGDPCCATTMTMTVPSTVSPKYNNQMEYNVKHLASSFQIIHESRCVSPGASCTLSGTCKLSYRVQWVLVETYDGNDMFIPVEVGNHCYCQYR